VFKPFAKAFVWMSLRYSLFPSCSLKIFALYLEVSLLKIMTELKNKVVYEIAVQFHEITDQARACLLQDCVARVVVPKFDLQG